MSMVEPMIAQLEEESGSTRKLLERTPMEHADWRPHAKSMSLAELTSHMATCPEWAVGICEQDEFEIPSEYTPWIAKSQDELLAAYDASIASAKKAMTGLSDAQMRATWKLIANGTVMVEAPRADVLRWFILSHLIHHRGQLSVYLRLKDVPLPAIYGPSADEQP